MSDNIKRLGDAEQEIMLVIWENDEAVTSNHILNALKSKRNWALSTLMTSLARLVEKGFIICDRSTGTNMYSPIISESDYKAKESKTLLERMYGNSLQRMITNLYDNNEITDGDIDSLQSFLDNIKKGE